MSTLRFRYALEPVLLTRQWARDALLLTLAEHNVEIAALAALQAGVQENYTAANAEWQAIAATEQAQPAQRFAMCIRYLDDLARQLREQTARLAQMAVARDDVIAQVVSAQRAVEAAEQHRGEMKEQFIRKRLSADFKLADDQWTTLRSGAASYGI